MVCNTLVTSPGCHGNLLGISNGDLYLHSWFNADGGLKWVGSRNTLPIQIDQLAKESPLRLSPNEEALKLEANNVA